MESELKSFVENLLSKEFKAKITDKELIITFDSFDDGKNHIAINIKNNAHLKRFSDLLNGRIVKLVGNYVSKNTSVVAVNIEQLLV